MFFDLMVICIGKITLGIVNAVCIEENTGDKIIILNLSMFD